MIMVNCICKFFKLSTFFIQLKELCQGSLSCFGNVQIKVPLKLKTTLCHYRQ